MLLFVNLYQLININYNSVERKKEREREREAIENT